MDWAKRPKRSVIYTPGQYSDEPWISKAVTAWFLGKLLGATAFQEYALSQFIQNCAIAVRGPWKLIEEEAPARSPLLRFSNHWVAWNAHLSGPGLNEYTGLRAAHYAKEVTPAMRDPRTFDMKHWYSDCGDDINAKCAHDPVVRANQLHQEQLSKRPPPPVWGVEYELAKNRNIGNPARGTIKRQKTLRVLTKNPPR